MLHVRPIRTYRGQPAKTRLISNTIRVPATHLRPPATVNKPENSRLHQGGSAGVFRFEPDPTFVCCTARCMSHFENADDDRVVQARQPLYNSLLSVDDRRAHLRDNWKKKLLIDHHGQQRPVCLTCACKIYVCSRSKLCPQSRETGRSKAESNSARAKKNVSVGAWFYVLMETLDVMPDTGLYQLQCGRKHMLFENYSLDVACWPDLYLKCEKSHFYHVWRESFPNVKLRKHCRYAKCEFCIPCQSFKRQMQGSGSNVTSTGHTRASVAFTTPSGMKPSSAHKEDLNLYRRHGPVHQRLPSFLGGLQARCQG